MTDRGRQKGGGTATTVLGPFTVIIAEKVKQNFDSSPYSSSSGNWSLGFEKIPTTVERRAHACT